MYLEGIMNFLSRGIIEVRWLQLTRRRLYWMVFILVPLISCDMNLYINSDNVNTDWHDSSSSPSFMWFGYVHNFVKPCLTKWQRLSIFL